MKKLFILLLVLFSPYLICAKKEILTQEIIEIYEVEIIDSEGELWRCLIIEEAPCDLNKEYQPRTFAISELLAPMDSFSAFVAIATYMHPNQISEMRHINNAPHYAEKMLKLQKSFNLPEDTLLGASSLSPSKTLWRILYAKKNNATLNATLDTLITEIKSVQSTKTSPAKTCGNLIEYLVLANTHIGCIYADPQKGIYCTTLSTSANASQLEANNPVRIFYDNMKSFCSSKATISEIDPEKAWMAFLKSGAKRAVYCIKVNDIYGVYLFENYKALSGDKNINELQATNSITKLINENFLHTSPLKSLENSIVQPDANLLSQNNNQDSYWQAQMQYRANAQEYYGSLPKELEEFFFVLSNKEEFKKFGAYKDTNFIFYGPPGTGKTLSASIFAQKINAEFMYVKGNELFTKWQGSGLEEPAKLFSKARARRDETKQPVVMFIDEIDTVVGSRQKATSEGQAQLVGSLLKEIGADTNKDIIVVAATNKIDDIDEALLRSGRFENHIKFCLPSPEDRRKIFSFLLFQQAHEKITAASDIDWTKITQRTEGCSQADLKRLATAVKVDLVKRRINDKQKDESPQVRHADIEMAIEKFKQQQTAKSLGK